MSGPDHGGDARLPPTVGRYRIVGPLAQDFLGAIFEGFDPLIERPVVVKVFHLAGADAAAQIAITELFYQEMQRTGALVHPAIVPLFDAGACPPGLFTASEFVAGASLADRIARGEMDVAAAVGVVAQVVDALEYAHASGVPHLHLKPTNILVTNDALVKLGGFGTAAVIDAIASATGATREGVAQYQAPERLRGEAGDVRSDIFSLGAIALDLFGMDARAALGLEAAEPLPPALAGAGVRAEAWAALVARTLAPDPAARFDSVRAFYQELVAVTGISAPEARPAWEAFGLMGSTAPDADSVDSETAIGPGFAHDARTIEMGGGTPRPMTDETLAADYGDGHGRRQDDDRSHPAKKV
jgi:serine/threonine-protein kinase